MAPVLKKADLLRGKNLILRNVTMADAEFILALRTDPEKSVHISQTSGSLEDQRKWLSNYEKTSDQAYFIICDLEMKPLGCIRMYAPDGDSYTWGSWLLLKGLSPYVSIESAIMIYAYGKSLGFKTAKLDVRKDNVYVVNFHEKLFGARRTGETEIDYFLELDSAQIDKNLKRYSHLVPEFLGA
jgi:hypothetical protein